MTSPLGLIVGTGFSSLDALSDASERSITTAYGDARVTTGDWHGIPVAFVTRHGPGHTLPPHRINYRANIRALADLGCHDVIAVNVTGGINEDLAPGALVVLDDFLDFTSGRAHTFHDGDGPEGVVHTDVTQAYDPTLRTELIAAAATVEIPVRERGVYACFNGPRFETPAEIRLARLAGADVAGMTGVPEVSLAAEARLRYAALSLVVNPAAGVGSGAPITMAEIDLTLAQGAPRVLSIVEALVLTRAGGSGRTDLTGPRATDQ